MFTKSRLEALSDGVFAIAMTLLILDIKIPPNASGHLSEALAKDFHAWISFVVRIPGEGERDSGVKVNRIPG